MTTDDGLSCVACTEQITFPMFLKLAHERTQPPRNRPPSIPGGLDRPILPAPTAWRWRRAVPEEASATA